MKTDRSYEWHQRMREAVLRLLGRRYPSPLSVSAIAFHLQQLQWLDEAPDERDVQEALAFLQGMKFVEMIEAKMGAITMWKASAEGILYYERNLAP